MKKNVCFCLLWLLAGFAPLCYGQTATIDPERMGRDIDIMEKVINELFENMSGNRRGSFFTRSGSAQGSYVPGYGVLFVAPTGAGFTGNVKWAGADYNVIYFNNDRPAPRPAPAPEALQGKDVLIDRRDRDDGREKAEKNKYPKDSKPKVSTAQRTVSRSQLDSALVAQTEIIEKTMRDFLANYADAIGQLSGNERVMIIYDENARKGARFSGGDQAVRMPRINAEVKREDLQAFRGGKMSRKELDSRIKVNRITEEREQYQEYKVFAGILETLFVGDQDNLYHTRNISYNYLPDFGVIYLMDMEIRGNFMRVKSEGNQYRYEFNTDRDARSQADSTVMRVKREAYAQFGPRIREAMLDYGRTLRNLGSDQLILLTISLPTCEGCNVPERVNVSVKKSVLEAYEQDKMNRQQALSAITIGEK